MSSTTYFLCAGVTNCVALFERLGSAEAEYALEHSLKRMLRTLETNGQGATLLGTGSGELVAQLPSLSAACRSAIDLEQRIAGLSPIAGLRLSVRAGISAQQKQAARIAGMAGRQQVLLDVPPPPEFQEQTRQLPLGALVLYELTWKPLAVTPSDVPRAVLSPTPPPGAGAGLRPELRLKYRGGETIVNSARPVIRMGRDLSNDLLIIDRKASRHHGRIELRKGIFYLVDISTNGCYLRLENCSERHIHKSEFCLVGSGSVSFGCPSREPGAEVATFNVAL